LLAELLQDEGYHCVQAADGLEAVKILAQESFDLLITDFKMPHMNGIELLEWCRKEKIHFPVILITANSDLLPEKNAALSDCCSAIIKKPLDINSILTAIESAENRNHLKDC
jgi:two-component system, NtrC family, response regulator GlrR